MYEAFYGFTEKPFSLFPDHRFLFVNRRCKLALSVLEFGVLNKNGMMLLTGEPGIGKTTLLQKILADLDDTVIVGNLPFTQDQGHSVLPWVLKAFGLHGLSDRSVDMHAVLEDFFLQTFRQDRTILLVIDEAQNLSLHQLEELRLLFNLNDRVGPVFQILLAGHTQLREQLKDSHLSAFAQRIGTDFSLEPLSQEDCIAYVRHRTLVAGGSASLFSDKACEQVFHCTKGIPRLINQLCETSLIYGFSERVNRITEKFVLEAAQDRQDSGMFLPVQGSGGEQTAIPEMGSEENLSEVAPSRAERPDIQEETIHASMSTPGVQEGAARRAHTPKPQDFRESLPILKPKQRPTSEPVELVSNPEKYWQEGLKLRNDGWCLEAIQNFKRAATHNEYHASGWFQVGQCYLVLGRKKEAIKAFRTSLVNPHSSPSELAPIQYAIGQAFEDLGEIEESKRYYQLAHSSDPTFDPGQHDLEQHVGSSFSTSGVNDREAQQSWIVRWFRRMFSRSHGESRA